MDFDRQYMERALALAANGRGNTSPNPMVGCVIVRDDAIIGEGFHTRAGAPHAEINAIADAGGDIAGATLYLNLEPCCHQGKTPPCVDTLIAHKPARVVAAMADPNPLVAGQGFARLREAGIEVECGPLEAEARNLNEAFIKFITTGRPFVIAKYAMTLDGKIATRTGQSRWVTGDAARWMVHQLRDEVDAILVGSRTVALDNPSLTSRLERDEGRDPIRIVLDAEERLDPNRRIFRVISKAPTWIATASDRDYPCADDVLRLPAGYGGVDLDALMLELGRRNVMSLLIEGGGTVHASALETGVVDKVWCFIAPKIIGGRDAITPVEGDGMDSMDEAIQLENIQIIPVGGDVLIEGYVKK